MTQTEGLAGLLEDGELRQLLGGADLCLTAPHGRKGLHPFADACSPNMTNTQQTEGRWDKVEGGDCDIRQTAQRKGWWWLSE